jgi:carboxymethylenebutenolidase
VVIAPDLLSGTAPGGGGTAELGSNDAVRKAISSLPPEQITSDLNAAAEYVSALPASNGKVVVAGFCWGGSETFRYATDNKNLKAAFVFYGTGPKSADELKRIQCPVYGFYAGNDARVTSTVANSEKMMKELGKKYEPVTYDGAGHGFMRAGEAPDASAENKKARDQAWKRWKDLLNKL